MENTLIALAFAAVAAVSSAGHPNRSTFLADAEEWQRSRPQSLRQDDTAVQLADAEEWNRSRPQG